MALDLDKLPDRIYEKRRGRLLAILKEDSRADTGLLALIAANILSLPPVLASFALGYLGIHALARTENLLFTAVLVAPLLALAVATFPWALFGRVGKQRVTRSDEPALFSALDGLAAGLGVRTPDLIVFSGRHNASFRRGTFGRKSVMEIGLPLLHCLDGGETQALVGHELAHARERGWWRWLVVGLGIDSLERWALMFLDSAAGEQSGIMVLVSFLFTGIGKALSVYRLLIINLWWMESQADEFRADLAALRVASREGLVGLLRILPIWGVTEDVIDESRWKSVSFMESYKVEARKRILRRAEAARNEGASVSTHPRHEDRIALVEAAPEGHGADSGIKGLLEKAASRFEREIYGKLESSYLETKTV